VATPWILVAHAVVDYLDAVASAARRKYET
jgi:hypothetical protein